jgi:hypothetical protein
MFFKGQRIKGEWLASLPPGSIFHRWDGSMMTETLAIWAVT